MDTLLLWHKEQHVHKGSGAGGGQMWALLNLPWKSAHSV